MHVKIRLNRTGSHSVELDGHDVTHDVLKSGFSVGLNADGYPVVSMRLKPTAVDIDGDVFLSEAPPMPAFERCDGCGARLPVPTTPSTDSTDQED